MVLLLMKSMIYEETLLNRAQQNKRYKDLLELGCDVFLPPLHVDPPNMVTPYHCKQGAVC